MAPLSSPSPPIKKLLKSVPIYKIKPKSGPISPSPNSAGSSSAPPPVKKTRDLPNLSDCHGCSRRINRENPKNRLKAIDSFWRILLLCKKCRKSIHSGDTCSYCFRGTVNSGDVFQCRVCKRTIHKDCVRAYGDSSPWCYMGVGMEGSGVCVDCWVPDLLKNRSTFRVPERIGIRRRRKKKAEEGKHLLKNGECESEKVKVGRIAKKQKLMKNAVDLGIEKDLTKGDNLDGNSTNGSSSEGVLSSSKSLGKDSDQGQRLVSPSSQGLLSYKRRRNMSQLHSSSDIHCPPKDFSAQKIGLHLYKRDKARKVWSLNEDDYLHSDDVNRPKDTLIEGGVKNISDVNVHQIYLCTNLDRFGRQLVYRRTKFRGKTGLVKGSVGVQQGSSGINVNGAKLGLLTYKRGGTKKKRQLYDESTVASDADQQSSKLHDQCDAGFIKSVQINGDTPQVMANVISDKTTTHPCTNVDEPGQNVTNLECEQVHVADLPEGSFDANADQSHLFANVDRFGREILCYERCRFGRKLFLEIGLNDASEGSNDVNRSCNGIGGLSKPMLMYERNRNRKIWIWPLNESGFGECSLKPAGSK